MLYPLFEWVELTTLGEAIRASIWLFPFIEAFHLVAFGALGGAVLLVDLRLIGLAFRSQPVAQVAQEMRPWLLRSLAVAVVSGSLLFVSEPVCFQSIARQMSRRMRPSTQTATKVATRRPSRFQQRRMRQTLEMRLRPRLPGFVVHRP